MGAPLLFLHGASFTRQWLPFHEALAGRFDVIAPEHPGFGDTVQRPGFHGFDDYVLHYDALLDALNISGAHLVGHGLGARLAAHLATTYPRRFASVALIAPTGLRQGDSPLVDEFRMSPETRRAAWFNGREEAHRSALDLKGFPDDVVDAFADSTANAQLTWVDRFDRVLERRLIRIASPVLIIAPQEDRFAGPTSAARYAELIPGSSVITPTGPAGEPSSHAVHVEQPVEIATIVADHARSHGATSAKEN